MEEFSLHFCVCVYFSVYDHVYDWSRQLERVLRLLIIFYCKTKCHVLPIEGQAQVQWLIWNPVLSQMTKRANLILGFTLQRWGNEGKGKEVTRPASSSHCGETFMVLMTHEHELHPHGFEHILFSWWLFFFFTFLFRCLVELLWRFISFKFAFTSSLFSPFVTILAQFRSYTTMCPVCLPGVENITNASKNWFLRRRVNSLPTSPDS